MPSIAPDVRKYLRPDVVSRLGSLQLKARLVVEGFLTGLHRSPYHGFSVEFAEHRQYMPGDELKHVDWKVYGRTDRFYVKQYEEETNVRALLILDSSASMRYASAGNISKFEYATYLSAALSYLLLRQQDAIGFALYNTTLQHYFPPRSKLSYLYAILSVLEKVTPSEQTSTATALHQIAERLKRRSLVVLISDFFDQPEEIVGALKHFRHRNHELLVFHILDPRERDFRFTQSAIFEDMETGERITTHPQHIQKSYQEAMERHIRFLQRECRERSIDYVLFDTAQPFDLALRHFLHKRRRIAG